MKLQSIVIGDWSDDGHGKCERFLFTSNKFDFEIREAFRKSCDLTGYAFDTNDKLPNGSIPKARLLNRYEDSTLTPEVINDFVTNFGLPDPKLDPHPVFKDNLYDEENGQCVGSSDCFNFIMWFISLSLPDLKYMEIKPASINGYWGELNQMWGYGTFS